MPLTAGGDANLFVSFDVPFPTGHSYTYKQDENDGVEVFYMTSGTYGYCGLNHTASAGCTLYLSVTAFESTEYRVAVLDTASPDGTACAAGCAWKQIGDGECQPQCNVTSCYDDRGDCDARGPDETGGVGSSALHCHADCKPEWKDDGFCDAACFNAKCGWDGADCGAHDTHTHKRHRRQFHTQSSLPHGWLQGRPHCVVLHPAHPPLRCACVPPVCCACVRAVCAPQAARAVPTTASALSLIHI